MMQVLWWLYCLLAFHLDFLSTSKESHQKKKINFEDIGTYDLRRDDEEKAPVFETFVESCKDAEKSGVYYTFMHNMGKNISIRCNADFFGGGWTVVQYRSEGKLDFRQTFHKYKRGFGVIEGEFWYGLEKIYRMSKIDNYEVAFVIENSDHMRTYARYDRFKIGSEYYNYSLLALGEYSGEAGDAMLYHMNMPFSTYDMKNNAKNKADCSKLFWGGWWYNNCYMSNINGKYPGKENFGKHCYECTAWTTFVPDRALIFTQMMIRQSVKEDWAEQFPKI